MRAALSALVAILLLGGLLTLGGQKAGVRAREATPQSAPVVIASELLGSASPAPVEHPELALGRVTIMPGAVIPVHHHPGTQIGVVVQGILSYRVLTGEVRWQHGGDPAGSPTVIRAGESVEVQPGDALIEPPEAIHQGWNAGNVPVVIYVSTLFPSGSPRSILVDATPTP
jgi:quercetin dioxygenase-like cupin family protein